VSVAVPVFTRAPLPEITEVISEELEPIAIVPVTPPPIAIARSKSAIEALNSRVDVPAKETLPVPTRVLSSIDRVPPLIEVPPE
jgi:hypothetical protein